MLLFLQAKPDDSLWNRGMGLVTSCMEGVGGTTKLLRPMGSFTCALYVSRTFTYRCTWDRRLFVPSEGLGARYT